MRSRAFNIYFLATLALVLGIAIGFSLGTDMMERRAIQSCTEQIELIRAKNP